jgi:hypothetical protein
MGSQWTIRVAVGQNYDPEVLHRFCAAVGVGKVYGPYPNADGVNRYSFQVVGKNAKAVLAAIWPWISGPKRRQAEAALEKYDNRILGTGHHGPCQPDCTCGRHRLASTEGLTESQIRRREKLRGYQRKHRQKKRASA